MEPQDEYAFIVWFRHHLPTLERLHEREDWSPEENLEDICRLAYDTGFQRGCTSASLSAWMHQYQQRRTDRTQI